MTKPLHIVLEFARAESAGQPHGFRFAAQPYLMRTPGGGFEAAEFPWSRALLDDLRALRGAAPPPEVTHRIGALLRDFLAGAGWAAREQAIVDAVRAATPIHITIRSAAAELYALPWELLALKSTGQLLGGIPGLVVRYEWPETASFPDPVPAAARRGRVLFAWSAAGGAVPAADHLAALQAALHDPAADFDAARDVIPHASFAAIAAALEAATRDGPPIDALHLLCHGAAAGGTYGLALDDQTEGGRVVVDAGRMQQLLAPHAGMLRVVVLAACDSGNVGELGNHVGSVAQMIHRAGLRAVVASRFPLSISGSSRFCAAFYAALAAPATTLERAFLAAREALVRDPGQFDWASVQLYARAADGDASYPLARAEAPVVVPPPSTPTPTPTPRRHSAWLALIPLAVIAVTLGLWRPWATAPAPESQPTEPTIIAAPTVPIEAAPPKPAPPPVEIVPAIVPTVLPEVAPEQPPKPADPATKTTPRKTVTSPKATGACPSEFRGFLENGLPTPAGGGARPDLRVAVASDGGLGYEAIGGDSDYASKARAKLPRLSERLFKTHGAALPCNMKLLRP